MVSDALIVGIEASARLAREQSSRLHDITRDVAEQAHQRYEQSGTLRS